MNRAAQPGDILHFTQWSEASEDCTFTEGLLTTYCGRDQLDAVVSEDGAVVGYLAYRRVLDEAELDQILIGPAYRRQGFAVKSLVEWHQALRKAGVAVVHLEVRGGNTGAVSMYQQSGYEVVGQRPNYYRFGSSFEPALLMKKVL